MAADRLPAFSQGEILLAALLGCLIEGMLIGGVIWAGDNSITIAPKEEAPEELIPIQVQPVLDELPLLKLGSSKSKPKLPEIWTKRAPVPVRRLEERAAPTEKAKDDPAEVPERKLADEKHEAPTEEDEIIKETDQELLDEKPPEDAPALEGEGAEDGSEHGTETDPLKARSLDLYRSKIAGWFNARFRPPVGEIPCEVLGGLSAGVSVQVGGDRSIVGFTVTSPSGDPVFDAKVQATLQGLVGQVLPPPPPLYPDLLGQTVFPRLSGAAGKCTP